MIEWGAKSFTGKVGRVEATPTHRNTERTHTNEVSGEGKVRE